MSWVEWQGRVWPTNDCEMELRVDIYAAESASPVPRWRLSLFHMDRPPPATAEDDEADPPWLDIEVTHLHFGEADWQRLAGLEIRADPAWHEAHEHTHDYGRPDEAQVTAATQQIPLTPDEERMPGGQERWIGHDFLLRFGACDGFAFPLELDAWLIREPGYYRLHPETELETTRFAVGPPNLRVLARAVFIGGYVNLPRVGPDPIPAARRAVREWIGLEEFHNPHVQWALRHTADRSTIVPMPGWRSTVEFSTRPPPSVPELPPLSNDPP